MEELMVSTGMPGVNYSTTKRGNIIFGASAGADGPSNLDIPGLNTNYLNCFFATGSGSFSVFEIKTNVSTHEFSKGGSSTNSQTGDPGTGRISLFPGSGNPDSLTRILLNNNTSTEISKSLNLTYANKETKDFT